MRKNHFKRSLMLAVALWMIGQTAVFAQTRQVTGIVTDSLQIPVANASVQIQGTGQGTVTDISGHFSISITGSDKVLVISAIGYKPYEQMVGAASHIEAVLSKALR